MTGYCGLPLPEVTLSIDGYVDDQGVEYWGKAVLQPNGKWHALANVHGNLCKVEVTIRDLQVLEV